MAALRQSTSAPSVVDLTKISSAEVMAELKVTSSKVEVDKDDDSQVVTIVESVPNNRVDTPDIIATILESDEPAADTTVNRMENLKVTMQYVIPDFAIKMG